MFNSDMTADKMKELIENKHSKDVCVIECKNGQSWGNNLRKLDAWVMLKTWSPFTTIGYEVKVSRSDFLNDGKWQEYLPYCHLFYFACPPGVISVDELPQEVGLVLGSKNLRNLVTKRKAVRREPEPDKLVDLMAYILMARTNVVSDMWEANAPDKRGANIEYYLEEAKRRQTLAANVRGHIREVYEQSIERDRQAEQKMREIEQFRCQLKGLGIEWNYETNNWQESSKVQDSIAELKKHLDANELRSMAQLGRQLLSLSENLTKKLYEER